MKPLLLLGTLVGVLALAAIAWALGLGRRDPLTQEEVATAVQSDYGPVALRSLVLSHDGLAALAIAHDGRLFAIKAHGVGLATRELQRPVQTSEDGDTLVVDPRDRPFGKLRLQLGRAQLPSVRAML